MSDDPANAPPGSGRSAPPSHSPPSWPAPTQGRYARLRELGAGDIGEVRVARDSALLRDVALKSLRPEFAQRPELAACFVAEAQIAGQLEHPNIVPVYDVAIDEDGAPYFSMRLIHGQSLSHWLAASDRVPGSSERLSRGLEIFMRVCDAVAYAHTRGVLHRDLKPDNVMVGEFGEVYLVDWGIAHLTGRPSNRVRGGGRATQDRHRGAGTPGYMAPEQARGEAIDERADIFGLGAMLHFVVTGACPYPGGPSHEVLAAASRGQVEPRSHTTTGVPVPRRLVEILARALAREPVDRYSNVSELREDVRRFLVGGLYLPTRTFDAGETIVQQGDRGDCAYVVVSGTCRVTRRVGDGAERELRTMGPGSVFGEMALLLESPRTASVTAIDTVTTLVVSRQELEVGLGSGSWLELLVKALAQRFRELEDHLEQPLVAGQ